MRKTFLFAILTLLALPTLAEYVYRDSKHEFLTPTTAWIEGFGYAMEGRYQVSAISLGYYTVDGDTLIDGKSYYRIRLNKVCHPFVYLEWDEQGREIIRDKEVETYDSDLCFFMREDESGDVWLYTDDTNTLGTISGNVFYNDIDPNYASGLVRHDLFLFNTRKPYSAGDKKPFGTIAFDSPEALYDGHNLFDWCIDSLEVKDVTGSVMLDGKEHWVSIYDYDLKYVQGIGPLRAGPLSGVGQPNSTYQRVFFAFYQGDQIIYRNEGYLSAIEEHFPNILNILTGKDTNGMESPLSTSAREENGALYDLQGRKLNARPQRGLYIQGGKMRMAW